MYDTGKSSGEDRREAPSIALGLCDWSTATQPLARCEASERQAEISALCRTRRLALNG